MIPNTREDTIRYWVEAAKKVAGEEITYDACVIAAGMEFAALVRNLKVGTPL